MRGSALWLMDEARIMMAAETAAETAARRVREDGEGRCCVVYGWAMGVVLLSSWFDCVLFCGCDGMVLKKERTRNI